MPSPNSSAAAILADGSPRPQPSLYDQLPPKTKLILHLQLQGYRQREISELLGIGETRVSIICRSKRYREVFDAKLDEVDDEFLRLKPKAFRALDNALCSRDEGLGLRAAETWFKAHGYRGFGPQSNAAGVTINVMAEDVAIQLLRSAEERRRGTEGGHKPALDPPVLDP
jgi:hypothetical protein